MFFIHLSYILFINSISHFSLTILSFHVFVHQVIRIVFLIFYEKSSILKKKIMMTLICCMLQLEGPKGLVMDG